MNKTELITLVLAVGVFVLAGVFVTKDTTVILNTSNGEKVELSAFPGPDIYADIAIHGKLSTDNVFTQGGKTYASSTSNATETALESYFDDENVLAYTPNVTNTLTLPASTTITDWIPNDGDVRVTYIQNASSTAGAVLTLAAGTGIDIQEPTGAALTIEGLDWARLTWIRKSNTDILVIFDELQEGD